PATRPEGRRVVAALVAIRSARPLPRAAHVDDARIARADVFHVDAQALARARQEVGEEHVAAVREPVEELAARRLADVDPDAALAAVALLHHEVDTALGKAEARGGEAALRVAVHRVLDLDHLGAPVAEHRTGRGHEPPLRHLEHLDSSERTL